MTKENTIQKNVKQEKKKPLRIPEWFKQSPGKLKATKSLSKNGSLTSNPLPAVVLSTLNKSYLYNYSISLCDSIAPSYGLG